jgi:(1->4)-alpha-D-glucan 1-alpha-D-glucosylmutase
MDPSALAETLLSQAAEAAGRARLPESTYRLQLHAGFTFRDATAIAPYLRDLGITHAYASPYLKARPGSTHGYDIVDHCCLNPEIGTDEDYEAWVAALREGGLGQVIDTVPNHMGVGTNENAWWNDVLENGPASRYGAFFDISWRSSGRPELQDKVLLPTLGDPYGDVLEGGQLKLSFAEGAFSIHYYDRRFPVAPRSYDAVLGHRLDELERALGPEDPALIEYQSILTAARNLPKAHETEAERVAERSREKEVIKRRLATLAAESEPVRRFIEENVAALNGREGDPRSFDPLDELLERQNYRLAYWRVAPDEINYRRFFDINDLAALSMEREDVFQAAHRLVLGLVADGKVDGLRIDHPDGLYDPAQYFRRLQEHHALTLARRAFDAGPGAQGADWAGVEPALRERIAATLDRPGGPLGRPLYVVAEKILGADEELVESWPVHGTSGYDFLNQVNGLFVDPDAAREFTRRYNDHVQDDSRFGDLVYRKKALIMQASLSSELHMLTHQLDRLAQKSRRYRDFTFNTLRRALGAVIAAFPVYRSYIADEGVHDADRRYIEVAVRRATARNPLLSRRVFGFIRDMLLIESPDSFTEEDRAEQRRFAGKFQQVTAPVTAKGVEDTAFYVYNRLASLNEVGGEPGRFGLRPDAVHAYNRSRQARWPYALSPLSTHDTKRSEDVRARINVLSEMADDWWAAVERWGRLNEPHRGTKSDDDQPIPDANEEYLLYQTLVGAWPPESDRSEDRSTFIKRIQEYMLKALHEAKVHTSWINPNAEYDEAVGAFVGRILDEGNRAFLDDFLPFQRRVAAYGLYNSLSQTLLKLAMPGVPDTYQGTELWDFSLVDPDNRRPVDYGRRARMLGELRSAIESSGGDLRALAGDLLASREDGRIKLYVTHRTLAGRRDRPGLFTAGEYLPLAAEGPKAANLFAFARRAGEAAAVVAVPRLITRLTADPAHPPIGAEAWADTRLPLAGLHPSLRWRNLFTGEVLTPGGPEGQPALAAADLFARFPVALLLADRGE